MIWLWTRDFCVMFAVQCFSHLKRTFQLHLFIEYHAHSSHTHGNEWWLVSIWHLQSTLVSGSYCFIVAGFLARQNCWAYSAYIATATPASPSAPFESKSVSLAVCNPVESSWICWRKLTTGLENLHLLQALPQNLASVFLEKINFTQLRCLI